MKDGWASLTGFWDRMQEDNPTDIWVSCYARNSAGLIIVKYLKNSHDNLVKRSFINPGF